MPSANIEPGNNLAGLIIGLDPCLLIVSVYMVAILRIEGVIHVTGVVPYPVFLADSHMAHLYREEVLEYRLPNTSIIYIAVNPEYGGFACAIPDAVKTGFRDVAEVCLVIVISHELSIPGYNRDISHGFLSIGCNPDKLCTFKRRIASVCFDDGDFLL